MRASVEAHFTALLDGLEPGQPLDFVRQVAFPVPTAVIGEMVGLPVADRAWFARHAAAQRHDKDPGARFEDLLAAAEGRGAIARYVGDLIDERRRALRDDLVSALITAEHDGDRLTRPELIALTSMLYIAAYGTTADSLCNTMLTLLAHPDQLGRLRADPALTRRAYDEVLRFEPVVLTVDYWTKEDVELAGSALPAGTPLHLFLGAANRDPAAFADPDRFDIGRDGPASLSFGAGAHFCLGSQLARLEGEVALSGLLARFSRWELAEPAPERIDYFNYRSHRSITVVLQP
jgi:cytochrome P450